MAEPTTDSCKAASDRLVLGGHSFIQQLGNDPPTSQEEQVLIVQACLDAGITHFDTTYQPERTALGKALAALGRRDEATIIAWNFFVDFVPGGRCGGPAPYQREHIDLMCEQLHTDRIDMLVVHGVDDEIQDARQEALAVSWREQGRVGRLGVWAPGADARSRFGIDSPYDFMVLPYNVTTEGAAPVFAACRRLGWETLACSPFVRGWELDKLVLRATELHGGDETDHRHKLADLMLRYSLFAADVDRLIVAIRRVEWVSADVASASRGPLDDKEVTFLESLLAS